MNSNWLVPVAALALARQVSRDAALYFWPARRRGRNPELRRPWLVTRESAPPGAGPQRKARLYMRSSARRAKGKTGRQQVGRM